MDDDDHTLKSPVTGNREHKTRKATDLQFAPGDIIAGVYQVISFIGAGGMSNVYKCRDISLDRIVAVKALQTGYTEDSLRRFQTEGRAIARLEHQHIVKMYGLQTTADDEPILVMEYITGQTLTEVLNKNTNMPVDRVLNITRQICEALTLSEREGIVHRDLKPSNIMLVDPGTAAECVKILDFGIAKIRDSANHDATKTGDIFGTPNYMSPEQALGKKCDPRSDQYALGCILFEMLSGRPPFTSENILSVILMHVQNPVPTVTEVTTKHLPSNLAYIVRKMMQKRPDDRFANFWAVQEALTTVGQKTKNSNVRIAVYCAVSAALAGVLACFFTLLHTHPSSPAQRNPVTGIPANVGISAYEAWKNSGPKTDSDDNSNSPYVQQAMKMGAEKTDKELNDEYDSLVKKVGQNPATKEKLRDAELAWMAFRDAHLTSIFPDEKGKLFDGSACYETELVMLETVRKEQLARINDDAVEVDKDARERLGPLEKLLDGMYEKAHKAYPSDKITLLVDAQEKWKAFRDAEIEFRKTLAKNGQSEIEGASIRRLLDTFRWAQLKEWADGFNRNKGCAGTRPYHRFSRR